MMLHTLPNKPFKITYAGPMGKWKYNTPIPQDGNFLEGIYVEEGNVQVLLDNEVISLMPKNLLLINATISRRLQFTETAPGSILRFSLSFDETQNPVFPGLLNVLNISLDICRMMLSLNQELLFPDAHSLHGDFIRLCKEYDGRKDQVFMTTLAYHLLAGLSRLSLTAKSGVQTYVEKADIYIHEHFYQIKNNEQIAAHVGLNATYLERIYKKYYGISLWECVTVCRLAAARELLLHPHIPIKEIELRIGFSNRQTFFLQFKKRYGMSPSEYRKSITPHS